MNDKNPLRIASELAGAGKTAEAIACLESALASTRSNEERPDSASTLARTAGLLCEEAGRLFQAAAYYEEAIAVADRDPLLLIALASVRWRLGQADGAHSCLARAETIARSCDDSDAQDIVAKLRAEWASGIS